MKHTVIWTPVAEQLLATIWAEAGDRQAVTTAADLIDDALRNNPISRGESRFGSLRVMFQPPLGAEFEVFDDDRIVRVLAVFQIGIRR